MTSNLFSFTEGEKRKKEELITLRVKKHEESLSPGEEGFVISEGGGGGEISSLALTRGEKPPFSREGALKRLQLLVKPEKERGLSWRVGMIVLIGFVLRRERKKPLGTVTRFPRGEGGEKKGTNNSAGKNTVMADRVRGRPRSPPREGEEGPCGFSGGGGGCSDSSLVYPAIRTERKKETTRDRGKETKNKKNNVTTPISSTVKGKKKSSLIRVLIGLEREKKKVIKSSSGREGLSPLSYTRKRKNSSIPREKEKKP